MSAPWHRASSLSFALAPGVELELRAGDLLPLPVDDAAADIVLFAFGVIFAPDPAQSLREIAPYCVLEDVRC